VLPAFTELEQRSNDRFEKASLISTVMYTFSYIVCAFSGVIMFGDAVDPNFLMNVSSLSGSMSVFCRTSYCFVLMFHIPYFFFTIKEYILVLYDEILDRSLSMKLEVKLAEFFNKKSD